MSGVPMDVARDRFRDIADALHRSGRRSVDTMADLLRAEELTDDPHLAWAIHKASVMAHMLAIATERAERLVGIDLPPAVPDDVSGEDRAA